MSLRFASLAAVVCVGLGATLLGGCETAKEREMSATRSTAAHLRTELMEMPGQVDKTMAAMRAAWGGKGDSNLMNTFSNEIGRLQKDASRVRNEADAVTSDADGYFGAWSKEIAASTTPKSRQAETAQMELSRANFRLFQTDLAGAGTEYNRLLGNLTDIKLALEKNPASGLSPEVSSAVDSATVNAANVKNKVNVLVSRINGFLSK